MLLCDFASYYFCFNLWMYIEQTFPNWGVGHVCGLCKCLQWSTLARSRKKFEICDISPLPSWMEYKWTFDLWSREISPNTSPHLYKRLIHMIPSLWKAYITYLYLYKRLIYTYVFLILCTLCIVHIIHHPKKTPDSAGKPGYVLVICGRSGMESEGGKFPKCLSHRIYGTGIFTY